jgi:hypothetical protein
LREQRRVVDRAAVEARRRAGLEPAHAKRPRPQFFREPDRRRVARPAAGVLVEPDVDAAPEKRADRQHYRRRFELEPDRGDHATDTVALDAKVGDLGLEKTQVGLVLDDRANGFPVKRAIGLGAGCADRRSLAGVERAELDAGAIDRTRHGAAERVDFLDQVTFADAPDGRIAAHLPERLDALGDQQRARTHPGRREGGLGAGVTAAHHDDVERGCKAHGTAGAGGRIEFNGGAL